MLFCYYYSKNTGVQNWPSSSSHSYVLTSWAVFSAILILIYSSLLINFLTVPAKLEVPTTWDELLKEPDYNILMPGDSYLKTMFEVSWKKKISLNPFCMC